MARTSIRLWFALAVAVLSAAVADPVLEFASNHGVFGPGSFTDHSNLDVLPALLVGLVFAALHLALRVYGALRDKRLPAPNLLRASGEALSSGLLRLLPGTFALQIAALYLMETCEQYAVFGHALGPAVWLGGPVAASLAFHALTCAMLTFCIARAVRACAQTTLRVIAFIVAAFTHRAQTCAFVVRRSRACIAFSLSHLVLCCVGERAPPAFAS